MLASCSLLALLLGSPLGVRTLPEGDGWAVRFEGDAAVRVDGRPHTGDLRLPGDRAHEVVVGDLRFEVPARPRERCAPLRFVALGDGRAHAPGVGPSAYWAPLLAEALAVRPAFVVQTGDAVKDGRARAEWDAWLRTIPPWPPIVSVRGNHDRGPHFEGLGLAPGPVFGHDLGPVFLVGLDTEVPDVAPLAEGLDRLLAAAQAPWKVVALHRPIWSNGNHGSDERGFNAALVPVFDRHRVDLVLAGHDHDYERFCPSVGTASDRRCDDKGTTYIVTGGAGTFTNPVPGVSRKVDPAIAAVDRTASRAYSGAQHYVVIDIAGGRLTGEARAARAGNLRPPRVLDRFEIERPVCR